MPTDALRLVLVSVGVSPDDSPVRELISSLDRATVVYPLDRLSDAISLLSEMEFDAVILDAGDQLHPVVVAIHKVHGESPDTPIVVITAERNHEDAAGLIREGAQDCLPRRELNGPALSWAIHNAVERNRTEQRLIRVNQTLVRRVEERTGYVRLLQDIAIIANEADTVEQALHSAVNHICRFMDWPVGHGYSTIEIVPGAQPVDVWHLSLPGQFWPFYEASRDSTSTNCTSLRGAVSTGRTPLWVTDVTDDELDSGRAAAARQCGLSTGFAFPVFLGHEVVALLEFFSTETSEPSDGFLGVMAHVGTQLGRVVERRRLQQQLIETVWRRQRDLGQDLHDGLGQELTGIGMLADSLRRRISNCNPEFTAASGELVDLIRRSQQNLRRISKGLQPVDVDAEGLRAALEELAMGVESSCGIQCRFRCDGEVHIADNHVATHLFRIAQEAVNNAVKHASPRQIEIEFKRQEGSARLQIVDDGIGIGDPNDHTEGIGLKTMRYRADVIDAAFDIRTNGSAGTQVTCMMRPKN